jgi:hypothetical protein
MAALSTVVSGQTEKLRNEHAVVTEYRLAPGESCALAGSLPAVTVYYDAGTIETAGKRATVQAGESAYSAPGARTVKNAGGAVVRFALVEFPGKGSAETWGTAGLAPNYKLLVENRYTRVYDIRIPAGEKEPQHTHHDRVVISLSGAELEHILPDGRLEPSTLHTGEIAWRRGATHIGHNLGKTNLWVIAVEPK